MGDGLQGLVAILVALVAAGPVAGAADAATASPPPAAGAPKADGNAIAWDPAIRRGVLPNGLRYAVMRNATPAGGVSIRLGVGVGSLEEDDAERGAAHFVEHMAFGSAAGDGAFEPRFAAAGVAFGEDRNAHTDYYDTLYAIDAPHADADLVALAFRWLRAVADGARFDAASLARQRGVILAERETGQTPQEEVDRRRQAFLTPGTRFLDRDPIGTPQSLAAMTPERLAAFYSRWYRPANAVVVAVGDAPVDQLEAQITAAFGDWRAAPSPARVAIAPLAPGPAVSAHVIVAPSSITALTICQIHDAPPRGADNVARLRRETMSGLWTGILSRRLEGAVQDPLAALLTTRVATSFQAREVAGGCIGAAPSQDRWRPALARLERELGAMAAAPPSEDELDAALKQARSYYRGAAAQAATRPSRDIADSAAREMLRGDIQPSPAEAFRAFDAAVADVTPADVAAAFRRDWSGGARVVLISPTPVAESELAAAWAAPAPASGPQQATATRRLWAYVDFGRPGRVVKREAFSAPDFRRVTFANGVVLNLMTAKGEQGQVRVAITFGAGRQEIGDADYPAAQLGAILFKQTGLGRHDYADIQALYADREWSADLHVGPSTFVLTGGGASNGLADQLRLLTAFVSDPGFRNIDPVVETMAGALRRTFRSNPRLLVTETLNETISPGGPDTLPSDERLAALRTADFSRVFKPALTEAPLQVSLVGDMDPDQAESLVAQTLGALPRRAAAPRPAKPVTFLRFPTGRATTVEVTHDGSPDQAVVAAVWPLYVAEPARRREEYALGLVAGLLRNRLLRGLRDDLGKTYAPIVATSMPDDADQGRLESLVETSPADLEVARREIETQAARLAHGDFTAADLEAVRAPMLAQIAEAGRRNDYWLGALAVLPVDPGAARELAERPAVEASISLDEVRRAAAAWLSAAPIVILARPSARLADPAAARAP
jgi:zinc protease